MSLSQHITVERVKAVQPKSGFILSASALVSESSDTCSRASKPKVGVRATAKFLVLLCSLELMLLAAQNVIVVIAKIVISTIMTNLQLHSNSLILFFLDVSYLLSHIFMKVIILL